MEEHKFGLKILSLDKWYIYPNCKENLLKAISEGYDVEYDTNEISKEGHHKIWIPYYGEIVEHFSVYRLVPNSN